MIITDMIGSRAVELGRFIVEHNATVRQAAGFFCISKSTVHKDVTERLKQLEPALYVQVKKVLDINKAQRHIRGGQATKQKYLMQKNVKEDVINQYE